MLQKIKANLKKKLPGSKAWSKMAVKSKNKKIEKTQQYDKLLSEEKLESLKKASVLIALFDKEGELYFPLIKRPKYEKNHPGQIALPGGTNEKNETFEETALREAQEEVGLNSDNVEIIGKLTPIPVPVSDYLIYPYIGYIKKEPKWKICKEEVDELFILKLSELLKADNGYSEEWILRNKKWKVPIFKVMNQTIWGATASVLSELIELTK